MIVNRKALLEELHILQGAIAKKTKFPLLECVRLRSSGDVLTLATTNLDVFLTSSIDASGDLDIALPAARLLGVLNSVDTETVDIRKNGTVKAGQFSCVLPVHSTENFPEIPAVPYTVATDELRQAIDAMLFGAIAYPSNFATDALRMTFDELFFQCEVSSNTCVGVYTATPDLCEETVSFLLPATAAAVLRQLVPKGVVKLGVDDDGRIGVDLGQGRAFVARQCAGKFSDSSRVFALEFDGPVIEFARAELREAVARVAAASGSSAVLLTSPDGPVHVWAQTSTGASEEILSTVGPVAAWLHVKSVLALLDANDAEHVSGQFQNGRVSWKIGNSHYVTAQTLIQTNYKPVHDIAAQVKDSSATVVDLVKDIPF